MGKDKNVNIKIRKRDRRLTDFKMDKNYNIVDKDCIAFVYDESVRKNVANSVLNRVKRKIKDGIHEVEEQKNCVVLAQQKQMHISLMWKRFKIWSSRCCKECIYIHDKDFYPMGTLTCCQLPLDKMFKKGFNTGHGKLRTSQIIQSYASLTTIAIQSNKNEMHKHNCAFGK